MKQLEIQVYPSEPYVTFEISDIITTRCITDFMDYVYLQFNKEYRVDKTFASGVKADEDGNIFTNPEKPRVLKIWQKDWRSEYYPENVESDNDIIYVSPTIPKEIFRSSEYEEAKKLVRDLITDFINYRNQNTVMSIQINKHE